MLDDEDERKIIEGLRRSRGMDFKCGYFLNCLLQDWSHNALAVFSFSVVTRTDNY